MKVYRKVLVSERLPKKDGNYIVGYEYGSFQCAYSREYSFHEEFTDCSIIEWWLEEIELPSDDEILEAVLMKQDKDQTQFMRGIEFILNKLKGETK